MRTGLLCLIRLAAGAANFPMTPAEVIPSVILDPHHQFWFLHSLVLATLLIGVAVRAGVSRRDIFIGSVLLLGITLVVYNPVVIRSLEKYALYLCAGFWLGVLGKFPPAWAALPAFGALAVVVSLG